MDNSTILFVLALVFILVILRWLITPIPQSVPEEFNIPDPARQSTVPQTNSRQRRQVTQSMIEVVQAIGPHLTVSQVKYSLENTGSVEATVEALMENGNLPFPPGEHPSSSTSETNGSNKDQKVHTGSLLEKYDVNTEENETSPIAGKWGKDENERIDFLRKRKADMILKARKNMKEVIGDY